MVDPNPYAPPKAPVADVEIRTNPGQKPDAVKYAVALIWTSYGLGVLGTVIKMFKGQFPYELAPLPGVLAFAASQLPTVWFTLKLAAGRNWARIVWIVLFGIGLLSSILLYEVVLATAKDNIWIFIPQTVVGFAVFVLLLTPSAA
ncbi:MAG TPA: hypothetical protein VGI23_12870, partial [Steroidobacteraceae bacterium]